MVCKMVKKGLMGAALTAGGLYLVFGTHAPSYVKTAFHKVRERADDAVSIQFKIDAAKNEIASLEPAIHDNMETLVRAEVDVDHLNKEIASTRQNLEAERSKMVTLREKLATGDLKLAKNSNVRLTEDEVKIDLAGKMDRYHYVQQILSRKEETLKARQKAVEAARGKLADMRNQKLRLAAEVEAIQAKLQMIEATEQKNEFHFDDSALARAKQSVQELSRKLEIKTRLSEMEGHFTGEVAPTAIEPDRDVVKEFDAEFGSHGKDAKSSEKKSL